MAAKNGHSNTVELRITDRAGGTTGTAAGIVCQRPSHKPRLVFKASADRTIGSSSTGQHASRLPPACITFVKQAHQATILLHELEAHIKVKAIEASIKQQEAIDMQGTEGGASRWSRRGRPVSFSRVSCSRAL